MFIHDDLPRYFMLHDTFIYECVGRNVRSMRLSRDWYYAAIGG